MQGASQSIKESWLGKQKLRDEEDSGDVSGNAAADDVIERHLCKTTDLRNGEMRNFDVEGVSVLLVKDKGEFAAIGGKCPHYGAPLANGVYSNGKVRCPWHGACFNTKTGDIEDFPGLDCVPKYQTKIVDNDVYVIAARSGLSNKRVRPYASFNEASSRAPVVVIGGGPSAHVCVETMRQEGYRGRIWMIHNERHLPYDRVQVTKKFDATYEQLRLRENTTDYDLGISVDRLHNTVEKVNVEEKFVTLRDGEKIEFSKLVIATGARPRRLNVPGSDLPGVLYMRTVDDNAKLCSAVKGKNVVIIGASFIGLESAALIAPEASSVTVICNDSKPLRRTMGEIAGDTVLKLFDSNGVKIETNASVVALNGKDAVEEVVLGDGRRIPADVVVAGIGVLPNTEFLKDSGIQMDSRGFVLVSEILETNVKDIYAIGDACAFPLTWFTDKKVNVQHYQIAQKHGRTAGSAIAGKPQKLSTAPFFWTVLFKAGFRFSGYAEKLDDFILKEYENGYNMYIFKDNRVVAVSSSGPKAQSVLFTEVFSRRIVVTKEEVKMNNANDWSHLLA
uniref:Rieske domain-containing protein n=1 Tax=Steinernema glaseri TaxID=37863 RepID=A0A1I8AVG0_9BILA